MATGPLSMCATPRLTSRTSLAESLLPICASVHSRHSTRKSLPGRTELAGGMSGCQRLWPGTAWSAIDLDWSTENATSGISSSFSQRLPRVAGIGMIGRGPMSFSTSPNPTHHAQIPSTIATQPDRLSRKLLSGEVMLTIPASA